MRFSDWQLNRLRDALRAYHRYGRGTRGTYYAWVDVSAAIDAYTGVEVAPERLRQFVEGLNVRKKGERRFPVPKDKSLEAIAKFVTDDEVKLLAKDELEERSPGFQAPLRLLEFLGPEGSAGHDVPAGKLEGRYAVSAVTGHGFVIRELTLQRPTDAGLIQVVETEDYYDGSVGQQIDTMSEADRSTNRKRRGINRGWAVLTPEDNLFFFLKNEVRGKNRYYFTVALNLWRWNDSPVTLLGLLYQDFPIELQEDETDWRSIAKRAEIEVGAHISVFERDRFHSHAKG